MMMEEIIFVYDKRFIARSSPKREKINWAFITKTNDESLRPFSLKVIKLATWH